MALKKQHFAEGEIPIFDEACIYKQGEYWWRRMLLPNGNKDACKSLSTRSEVTAVEKRKAACLEIYPNLQQGESYVSIPTKKGVEAYLSCRKRDVKLGHIIKGRHTRIATYRQHFLSFIIKDMKLKELERTDCENFFYRSHKANNGNAKQVTVQNKRANALKEVKRLCKEFGVTAGMLKGALSSGRKKK